jgi:spectinomycin phosphotransferase/16S rRNA (guanine(1405)-N(7))-methyltransferase
VFTQPDDLPEQEIRRALSQWWDFSTTEIRYEAVGFGSHHWIAFDRDGDGRFVTIDDVEGNRSSASESADDVFDRLHSALAAAFALRHDGGARDGALDLVVRLHGATAVAAGHADRDIGPLRQRDNITDALRSLDQPWLTGPWGEPCRHLLGDHASGVERLVAHYDALACAVLANEERMVITHGEPHAGNVMVSDGKYLLVDWDTALIAPPERDLWELDPGDGSVVDAYAAHTGNDIDPNALIFYKLWFDLDEIGSYVALFRAEHDDTADTRESWTNLGHFLRPAERWPDLM